MTRRDRTMRVVIVTESHAASVYLCGVCATLRRLNAPANIVMLTLQSRDGVLAAALHHTDPAA